MTSLAEQRDETRQEDECVHHWMIKSPNGPTVRGRCKLCGATREFDTSYNPRWNWSKGEEERTP